MSANGRRFFTITCVRQDDEGAWTAHVSTDGRTYRATRRHGSWSLVEGDSERIVLPHVATALQQRVRRAERRSRRDASS
jgi:hypothetical protein